MNGKVFEDVCLNQISKMQCSSVTSAHITSKLDEKEIESDVKKNWEGKNGKSQNEPF